MDKLLFAQIHLEHYCQGPYKSQNLVNLNSCRLFTYFTSVYRLLRSILPIFDRYVAGIQTQSGSDVGKLSLKQNKGLISHRQTVEDVWTWIGSSGQRTRRPYQRSEF